MMSNNINDLREEIKKEDPKFIEELNKSKLENEAPIKLDSGLTNPNPFPVHALGKELESLTGEMHRIIKAPIAICAQSILGCISLAAQPHANIFIDGRVSPISLYFFTVAKSGERKSAVDNVSLKPIDEYEECKQAEFQKEIERYENERIQNMSLSKKERIVNLPKPQEQTIIMTEPTFEGMIRLYDEGQPSMGLFSDEGGRFVYGHGMNSDNKIKTTTGLSSLWDGKYLSSVRAGTGAKKLYGRRLSFHLMLQPQIAMSVFSDNALIDQGFLGRCLLSFPSSTMGGRAYTRENIFETTEYKIYAKKITSLLSRERRTREHDFRALDPKQLTLSNEAFEEFLKLYDEIEEELKPKGKYTEISSFANKSLEHACRIAGCLTIYNDPDATEISYYYMNNAVILIRYYLNETLRLLGQPELKLQDASYREMNTHAKDLLDWMTEQHKSGKHFSDFHITSRLIRQHASRKYRDPKVHLPLLKYLEEAGWLKKCDKPKNWTLIIEQ